MLKSIVSCSVIINFLFICKKLPCFCVGLIRNGKYKIKLILTKLKILPSNSKIQTLNIPLVYRAKNREVSYLNNTDTQSAISLPNHLVIHSDVYSFENQVYQLDQEGLYRFINVNKKNAQRIVYQNDVAVLLASIAWIVTHGEQDDKLSYSELISKAQTNKLFLSCEAIARFSKKLLAENNIKSRVIGSRTFEPWNCYDNGHYLLEVYREDLKKWVLYDLDMNIYFTYQNKFLSLLEFIDHLQDNYEINFLSNDIQVVSPYLTKNNYDYTFINEARLNNLNKWYSRIMQFNYIEYDNENFSYLKPSPDLLLHYPKGAFPKITYLPKKLLLEKFYE